MSAWSDPGRMDVQGMAQVRRADDDFRRRLHRVYGAFAAVFAGFVLLLAVLEQLGMGRGALGLSFLLATVAVYAGIGILSRTNDPVEYYVAGRRVPAFYNGMAASADFMSAASFISLAGTLYLTGYAGLAFVLGWTGGFCLVGLLLAPYLRRFGQYTLPDFFGARFGGNLARGVALTITILVSFVYVVAQIYGVGLITSRLSGIPFEIGIFVGLGGVLVCSFLGGMRAVTWTQVAQYIVMLAAFLIPVVWLSVKQTGVPLPPLVVGQQLKQVSAAEQRLLADPAEQAVVDHFLAEAQALRLKLQDVPRALQEERTRALAQVRALEARQAPVAELQAAEKALAAVPRSEVAAREAWTSALADALERAQPLAGMPRHTQQFEGDPLGDAAAREAFDHSRRNFLALVFCLMLGTAALPHILVRYYTTPTVSEARRSVSWTLFFVLLLYFSMPALAVLVKHEIFSALVGMPFDRLPHWIAAWSRVDPGLIAIADVNRDGIVQLGEIRLGGDVVVLATPEIAGLPYVVSGLVAAGGMAAALSTADGLLLTIANALSHDGYHKIVDPRATGSRRVLLSKILLLVVAVLAAMVAAQKPGDIVFLVSAAFSLAAAGFFPALVLGIFWRRASPSAAILGMLVGLGVTCYYMITTHPWLRELFGVTAPLASARWWGIEPISAGVFGVPAGLAVIVLVSLVWPERSPHAHALVTMVQNPTRR